MIVENYKDYGGKGSCETLAEEYKGFHVGEVVYDQHNMIGIILAFYDGNVARVNSNGCCDVDELKKCPDDIAKEAMKSMTPIHYFGFDLKEALYELESKYRSIIEELLGNRTSFNVNKWLYLDGAHVKVKELREHDIVIRKGGKLEYCMYNWMSVEDLQKVAIVAVEAMHRYCLTKKRGL